VNPSRFHFDRRLSARPLRLVTGRRKVHEVLLLAIDLAAPLQADIFDFPHDVATGVDIERYAEGMIAEPGTWNERILGATPKIALTIYKRPHGSKCPIIRICVRGDSSSSIFFRGQIYQHGRGSIPGRM